MKKKLFILLLVTVLMITITGCGRNIKNAMRKEMVNDMKEVSKDMKEAFDDMEEDYEEIKEEYEDIKLFSDNSKIVFANPQMKLVYYYSGNEITGFTAYYDYGNNFSANSALYSFKSQGNDAIKNAYVQGKYVVVEYNETAYKGLTIDDVKRTNSYLEEVKENN